ncbi:hypothetical protein FHR90_003269 [Endobacter medicaginis]|uniref:Uncharacterized protein n=1 Tax=Endobacter medicaginis TaxID=1181271 RepID=A0A850NRK1_9PROT|nr:hypothetical protein [Endobacter medicaginis]MBB3175414.1 hypothetical protein [Endobacter medicaginis]MCX5476881.1 hypothetical protein [Endobacter medicaginis]NVN29578.1 hypothetical protein [Endobacter medicaginis]
MTKRYDIVFASGDSGWLCRNDGHVVGLQRWSETHVSSSGGGGHIDKYGGHIEATRISSTVQDRTEFWVKFDDGSEKQFSCDLSVRDGHRVAVIWGAPASQKEGKYLIMKNLTTGHWILVNRDTPFQRAYSAWGDGPSAQMRRFTMAIALLIFLVVLYAKSPKEAGLALVLVGLVFGLFACLFIVQMMYNNKKLPMINEVMAITKV